MPDGRRNLLQAKQNGKFEAQNPKLETNPK
jgi:hypothetical protein